MRNLFNFRRAQDAPTLYLTVGLPDAGATAPAVEHDAHHHPLRLTLDEWMRSLFSGPDDDEHHRTLLEGLVIRLALQALQFGTDVVLDFGPSSRNERSALRHLAAAVGANSGLVYRPVDRQTQDRWRGQFDEPDAEERSGPWMDGRPAGTDSWSAWAIERWPSFGVGTTLTSTPPRAHDAPTMTLFCGLPGAGKTTLAKKLEAAGRGVRICTDDWQAQLGVPDADSDFHERLQPLLYRCALDLLRHDVDVILEDGLWMRAERDQKFADARACGARIDFHVFDVALSTLWARLRDRNANGGPGACAMTFDELQWAASLFEPPTSDELAAVDTHVVHVDSE